MNDCTDQEARKDIGKIYARLAKSETVLWGTDGSDGLRSDVDKLMITVDRLTAACRKYLYKDRQLTCYGLKAIEAEKKDIMQTKEAEEKKQMDIAALSVQMQTFIETSKNTRRGQNLVFIAAIVSPIVSLVIALFIKK